jgi:ubiquinone/menaquinone biosynthesis C-methylase UbiE
MHPLPNVYKEASRLSSAILSLLLVQILFASVLTAQAVHPITGRRIAPVMGMSGADWLDREEREKEEQPEKALATLHLRPGMFVGDVGAGTGFYSLRMAQMVGPNGRVFSNDIQPPMLERLRKNAAAHNINNIETVLGTESNSNLPAHELDLVVMVDVYHELSRPQRMLHSIRDSLKTDGQLVLLEFRKEDPTVPIRPEHKMSVDEVKAEVMPEGYEFEKVVDTLPWQHIIFFRKARESR